MPDAGNKRLNDAAKAKEGEFYTQLSDIEDELWHYRDHFKDKTILCNCDDPYESNFFKYFVLNFNRLGLKKLIATSYDGSPFAGTQLSLFNDVDRFGNKSTKPYKSIVTEVHDATGDGGINMEDVEAMIHSGEIPITELKGNGDFRSEECTELLKEADIVVTNPPFYLFREYMAQLTKYNKQFIVIGNKNALSYKEIFPLIKENKIWLGYRSINKDMWFVVPEGYKYEKVVNGQKLKHEMACWYTNLDIDKRHEETIFVSRYTPEEYPKYDNYDAINVNNVSEIPCDYTGIMGVPFTFLNKYNPDQFEIIGEANHGIDSEYDLFKPILKGVYKFKRLLIRNLHPEPPKE